MTGRSQKPLVGRVLLVFLALVVGCIAARAEEPTARAVFSRDRAAVGEPVQLQISITGATGRPNSPEVAVEGLDIRYVGPSHSNSMQFDSNGQVTRTSTLTHIFQVVAQRAGTFTVPPLQIDVDGRALRTQPVALRVEPNGADPADATGGIERIGFAEFIVPKKTLYVGEMMPVELRLYIDARVRWNLEAMPLIAGDGFTKQKLTEPRQEQGRRDGKEYQILVFRTAITPSRAGKITLGPSDLPFQAQIPQQRRRGRNDPRSLLEGFFGDDPFNDPFFTQMRVQRVPAKAEAVELEVKPLPAAGRPKDFSGAVGQYRFSATGTPVQVKIGDPVTMKLVVSGRGSFDRVSAPTLLDPAGWHAYPASGTFRQDDDLGMSGMKTFDMAVVPEVKKDEMPRFVFSFFDPATEKYATLTSAPAPLVVEGSPAPVAPPTVSAESGASEQQAPPPPPASAPSDIVGLQYEFGRKRESFEPWHKQRGFWLLQLAPAVALLGWLISRRRRPGEREKRAAHLRREKSALWRKVRDGCSHAEFLEAAARLVQIDTALATGRPDGGIDAATARASRPLDAATGEAIDELFSARAELLYAGAGRGGENAPAGQRERVLAALEVFEKSEAKR